MVKQDQERTRFSDFTVNQAKSLLTNAGQFGLLPYIAIGLFAGLRSAELMRSEASAVDLKNRVVVVSALVAKKRSRRVVEMCDALAAWLGTCTLGTDQLVDLELFRVDFDKLRTAAGIVNWPPNGLRHSFGSYHLSFHGDAMKTAALMGHKDPSILHNHYKALVLKTEAEKYWDLRPKLRTVVSESKETPSQ